MGDAGFVCNMTDIQDPTDFFADKLGTECHGQIEFVGPGASSYQEPSKFVKISDGTDCSQILSLLTDEWSLGTPRLLISVTGGAHNFTLTSRLQDILRYGIIEAAVNTGAWIITGGTHVGVMKYIGEALKAFRTDCRIHDVVAIGIATWGVVDQRFLLEDVEDGNRTTCISTTKQGDEEREVVLDPNHTHFILVDDGSTGTFDVEVPLRAKLENVISNQATPGVQKDLQKVPVVCIAIEGGTKTIQTVYEAVQHDTPVIIVADTGRAADAITFAIQNAETSPDGSKLLTNDVRSQVRQLLLQYSNIATKRPIDADKCLQQIEKCLQKPHRLNIFEDSLGSEIVASILKAVLKAKQGRKQDQLFLAQALNQVNIAQTELFGCNTAAWKDDNLGDNLRYSLVANQSDFVKLFLDNGVSLKAYLQENELHKLYTKVQPGSLLHEILQKMKKDLDLMDIGKVILDLMAIDSMKLRYPSSSQHVSPDDGHTNEASFITSERNHRPISFIAEKASHSVYTDPAAELFLYAILNQFHEMARVFWEVCQEKLAAALTASAILNGMSKKIDQRDDRLKNKLADKSSEYEELAMQIVEECYSRNKRLTSLLLIRPLSNWGDETCVSLAVAGKNKRFIAHPGVQNMMKEIWYFGTSENNGLVKLMICALLPILIPLIPFLVRFQPDFESTDHGTSKKSHALNLGNVNSRYETMTSQPPAHPLSTLSTNNNKALRAAKFLSTYKQSDIGVVLTASPTLTKWQKIKYFYKSPKMTFKINVLFYLFFLTVYSYVMLFDVLTQPPLYLSELFLIAWAVTLSLDVIRKVADEGFPTWTLCFKHCFSDHWNQFDIVLLAVFWLAMTLRFVGTSATLHWGRMLLAFDLVGFYARLLKSFTYFQSIGPNIFMILKMFRDMLFFACIMLVFLLGFGVAIAGVQYPTWESMEHLSRIILYRTYFQIHGNLFLDEIEGRELKNDVCGPNAQSLPCPDPDARIPAIILTALYTALCHILLLTLLVAMFRSTSSDLLHSVAMITSRLCKLEHEMKTAASNLDRLTQSLRPDPSARGSNERRPQVQLATTSKYTNNDSSDT